MYIIVSKSFHYTAELVTRVTSRLGADHVFVVFENTQEKAYSTPVTLPIMKSAMN